MTHVFWKILKIKDDICDEIKGNLITNRKRKKKIYQNFKDLSEIIYRYLILKSPMKSIDFFFKI